MQMFPAGVIRADRACSLSCAALVSPACYHLLEYQIEHEALQCKCAEDQRFSKLSNVNSAVGLGRYACVDKLRYDHLYRQPSEYQKYQYSSKGTVAALFLCPIAWMHSRVAVTLHDTQISLDEY